MIVNIKGQSPTNTKVSNNERSQQIQQAFQSKVLGLFVTPSKEPFLIFDGGARIENLPITSDALTDIIQCAFLEMHDAVLTEYEVEHLVRYLRAKAMYSKNVSPISKRVARTEKGLEIDLNNEAGECVLVTGKGWEVTLPTSRFVRGPSMGVLPNPAGRANKEVFKRYFSVQSEDDLVLLIAFSLFTLQPDNAYPILNFKGPHGCGKSMAAELVKTLTDPVVQGARRGDIKTIPSLYIAASQGHILSIDNVSNISGEISDALCCLSTGGAYSARKLYTNDAESLIDIRKPVIINGIPDLATKQDLISRSLIVELKPLEGKLGESEMRKNFSEDHPALFAYLLDGLVSSLANSQASSTSQSRLAAFVQTGIAAEYSLGFPQGAFIKAFEANQSGAVSDSLELNPVVKALQQFLNETVWEGTMAELLTGLSVCAGEERSSKAWPQNARYLSSELARLAPNLPKVGITYTKLQRQTNARLIRLERVGVVDQQPDASNQKNPMFDESFWSGPFQNDDAMTL